MESITGTCNGWVVLLSYVVAVASSYTAVSLIGRLSIQRDRLRLFGSALMISIGLWSFHYTAMMAYRLPVAVHHDVLFFLLSVVIPFAGTYVAVKLFTDNPQSKLQYGLSCLVMGSGVCAMHYTGMYAIRFHAATEFDPLWTAVSWIAAVIDASVAFALAYRFRDRSRGWKLACSFLMGLGIVCVHFSGMYGTSFHIRESDRQPLTETMNHLFIASAFGIAAIFLAGMGVMTFWINRRLREAEQKYRLLFDQCPELVIVIGPDGTVTRANSKTREVIGVEPAEIVGVRFGDLVLPDDREQAEQSLEKALGGENGRTELRLRHSGGQVVEVGATIIPTVVDDKLLGVCVVAEDLTPGKRTREQLRRLTERHELILNTMVEGVFGIDADGRTVFWNKAAETMTGYTAQEVLGDVAHRLLRRPGKTTGREGEEAIAEALRERKPLSVMDGVFWRKDGTPFPVEYTINPIVEEDTETAAVVTFRDITDRKRQEDALRKSESQYRTLVENLPDALIVVRSGRQVYANDTAIRMLGLTGRRDSSGRRIFEEIGSFRSDPLKLEWWGAQEDMPLHATERKLTRADGSQRDVEVIAFPAWYEGEPARYVLIRDVTELKQARELIQRSEKLSVAGELAAGIAHEIRNPLTAIKGFIQLMKERMSRDYYNVIQSEIGRIELITGELLMLSKPQSIDFQPKEMSVILDHVATLLETQAIMRDVQIVRKLGSSPMTVSCDENQIKQVFINILKNSIEAMPEGGTVTIEAEEEDGFVRVVVRDEGVGIPEDKIRMLGQPFFTTKEKGTGLGLMISYNIVENHGGRIEVFSRPGEGTEFHITLPAVQARPQPLMERITPSA